jgi:hypothetical protein
MQISLPDSVTQKLQNTKNLLDNAVNSVSQNVQHVKITVTESTNQSLETINQTAVNAKRNFTEAANNTLGNVTEKGGQLLNSITNATNTLKDSLHTAIQKIDTLNQTLSDGIQASINSSLNNWIDQHPQIVWCINHPLQCLSIFLIGMVFFSGLLSALSKLTEKFWLLVLTYPSKILANIWVSISKSVNQDNGTQNTENQERITEILHRLEVIREEQTLLSQELESRLR